MLFQGMGRIARDPRRVSKWSVVFFLVKTVLKSVIHIGKSKNEDLSHRLIMITVPNMRSPEFQSETAFSKTDDKDLEAIGDAGKKIGLENLFTMIANIGETREN